MTKYEINPAKKNLPWLSKVWSLSLDLKTLFIMFYSLDVISLLFLNISCSIVYLVVFSIAGFITKKSSRIF
jgi:hypothetical protein